MYWCAGGLVIKLFNTFASLWTIAPSSMGFSRQEYRSGLPFPSPGNPPNAGLKLSLQHCRQILYHLNHQGSHNVLMCSLKQETEILPYFSFSLYGDTSRITSTLALRPHLCFEKLSFYVITYFFFLIPFL